uniref:Uncharacterized protein n=1 Tax=Oryza brachyantha TaxID=4533 RepID=J3L1R1_ORYBR
MPASHRSAMAYAWPLFHFLFLEKKICSCGVNHRMLVLALITIESNPEHSPAFSYNNRLNFVKETPQNNIQRTCRGACVRNRWWMGTSIRKTPSFFSKKTSFFSLILTIIY